jgi:hypothetical protein
MYKGFRLKNLKTIEVEDKNYVGRGSFSSVYSIGQNKVVKIFHIPLWDWDSRPNPCHIEEFIMQHRVYRAGMEVAKPYEMCRVRVEWDDEIRIGFTMDDLGRKPVSEDRSRHMVETYDSFYSVEGSVANNIGIRPWDRHGKNAMVLPDGSIKRIDLGCWEYRDKNKARWAAKQGTQK